MWCSSLNYLARQHAEAENGSISGTWDSIHIAEVTERSPQSAFYKLTTTIILQCQTTAEGVKNDVGGYRMQVVSVPRHSDFLQNFACDCSCFHNIFGCQLEREMPNDASSTHLVNMGTLVQEQENRMLSRELCCLPEVQRN